MEVFTFFKENIEAMRPLALHSNHIQLHSHLLEYHHFICNSVAEPKFSFIRTEELL
jgi:hypothetical protein